MDDRILIEVIHGSHEAILEFLFECDADVAQHRTSELGEEPCDEIEPSRAPSRAAILRGGYRRQESAF